MCEWQRLIQGVSRVVYCYSRVGTGHTGVRCCTPLQQAPEAGLETAPAYHERALLLKPSRRTQLSGESWTACLIRCAVFSYGTLVPGALPLGFASILQYV